MVEVVIIAKCAMAVLDGYTWIKVTK
jgi:hypothetical protein